jgi:hypothetical protein
MGLLFGGQKKPGEGAPSSSTQSASLELQGSGAAAASSLEGKPSTSAGSSALPVAAPPSYASTMTAAERKTLEHLERLAHAMDEAFTVPGLGWKFGVDRREGGQSGGRHRGAGAHQKRRHAPNGPAAGGC